MKKILSILFVAAAAMAVFSCQKQETTAPEVSTEEFVLTFTSEKPAFDDQTKTEWTGETVQWSKGDKIRVAYTCDGVWQNAAGTATAEEKNGSKTAKIYESTGLAEAGSSAKFTVPGNFKGTAEGAYQFYGIYPSSLVSSPDIKYAPSVTVNIPAEQTPSVTSFDSAADMMAAKSDFYDGMPKTVVDEEEKNDEISLKWDRLVAHGYFTLKNLAVVGEEALQSITLTANAEADMVGSHYLYLDTYNIVKPDTNTSANKLTINAENLVISEGNVSFGACFLPCTWTSLTVEVETSMATYTRTIDLSANQKTFVKNARNTLGINMATAEREVKAAAELPFVRDFSENKESSNAISELDGFDVKGSVYKATGAIRLAKGDAGGSITTQLLDLSQEFQVLVTAKGWDSDELTLNVTAGDQSTNLTLTADDFVTYAVNFNSVSASSAVTFTAESGKRCYISRIEILSGHDELPPVLKATAPAQMAAAGGEASFTFKLTNPKDGQKVTATSKVDWITGVSVGEGTVTYTVAENTMDEVREGVITLSYEGIDDVAVTISQAAAGEQGGYTVIKSVSDLTAGTYLMGGNNANTFAEGTMYMWSDASNVSGQKLKTTGVTFSNGDFTSDVSSFVAVELVRASADNKYYIKIGNKYLKGAAKVWSLENDPVEWTFDDMGGSKEGIYFYNTTNNSYVFINSTSDAIRTYGSTTKYKGIYFFKAN